jgi:two-component system response regulator AtoC
MTQPHALVVDDSPDTLQAMEALVSAEGFTVSLAPTAERARAELNERVPDVVLVDLNLPDASGMTVLDALEGFSAPAVILITGHASVDTAIEALRRGVTDYLTKPVDIARLRGILGDIAKTSSLPSEIRALRSQQASLGRFGSIVGRSPAIRQTCDLIARIAPSSASVLISGESGTGKDMVARTIHELSRRRLGPYIPVNCGAVSPTLIESELFGHERGSFTGADRRHKGYFERATRGTLFLDEITEMPTELQTKLLRVLETGSFVRLGGEEPLSVDVRIIAASNRSVHDAVESGRLREDLYYRLKVFQLHLPALRDRREDIPLLAQWFLEEFNRAEGTQQHFAESAVQRLREHDWPGNVRELRNVVHSASILADQEITEEHVMVERAAAARGPEPRTGDRNNVLTIPIGTPIAEVERRLILATLHACDGNKTKTAEVLGMSLKTLYNRLVAYREEDAKSVP